jgi:hypothetical protein
MTLKADFSWGTSWTKILVRAFCNLFEQKLSLIMELNELNEDPERWKIKKRTYRNRYKVLNKKLLEISRNIGDLKMTLRESGDMFSKVVDQLEISEAKYISAGDDLYSLRQRYSWKEISHIAYQKLLGKFNKRHKKAITRIARRLMKLREILT